MVRQIINKIKELDRKLGIPNWLCCLLGLTLILRIPSFFEPYSYGDEMIYLTLGEGIRHGLTLYKNIHDNKPPLIYLLAAIGGNLFWFKVILAFWMLVTVVVFWKLTTILFENNTKLQKIATVIFALLSTLPLLEGNIVNSELFLIGPIMLAFLILLTKPNYKKIFFAGLLFSLAALFKIPASFDVPAVVLFWIVVSKINKENVISIIKKTFVLALGFILPILATFIWYWTKGAFNEYLVAAFLQNVGYLSSWRGGENQTPFLVKNGPLLLRSSVILIGLVILKIKNKKLSTPFIFATIWLLTSLFAATLSERPYPHYLIQSIAPISILTAILLASTRIEQALAVIPLFLALLVPVYYKFYYYSTFTYYSRFIRFATHQISKEEYFDEFDSHVNRNYKIAKYLSISSNYNDPVFVWGDSPPIYALSKRLPPFKYVANYHISDFSSKEDVIKALQSNPPKFIVTLEEGGSFPALGSFLALNYVPVETSSNYEIWIKINIPKPQLRLPQ
ncbi:MAG TPA: hypothetical protein VF185_00960 [Patescibacteria group bacterium]